MFRKQTGYHYQQRLGPLWEGRSLLLIAGSLVTLICLLWVVYPPGLVRFAGHYAYDVMLGSRAAGPRSEVPVFVRIDERSLAEYGQWPWPRYRLAQLIERLRVLDAEVVVLDVLMPEADRTSPEIILTERKRDLGESGLVGFTGQTNDLLLARAISQQPTIVAFKFENLPKEISEERWQPQPLRRVIVRQEPGFHPLETAPAGVVGNLSPLSDAAAGHGFTNVRADQDGVLRRVPLLMKDDDGYYPGLPLAALMLAEHDQDLLLIQQPGEIHLQWHGRTIPLDAYGQMLIDFRAGDSPFLEISAAEILSNFATLPNLEGRIVFVGASAAALGDRHITPLNKTLPGPLVHATVVENLLAGEFLTSPGWTNGAEFFFVLLFGVLSTVLLLKSGFLIAVLLLTIGSGGVFWLACFQFQEQGFFISPVMSVVVVLMNVTILSLLKYGIESSKLKQRTRDLVLAQEATIVSMTALAEARDDATGDHIIRTQRYVEILARHLQNHPRFAAALNDEAIELLYKSAPLHDIGKIAIPDDVLFKPAMHTVQESLVMQNHTVVGARAIQRAIATLDRPEQSGYLSYALQMAESHHEKWDGSGYPYGLSGEKIPLAGRLMALVDVYDALISKRCYKDSFSHEIAKKLILTEEQGSFDPDIVEAFLACEDQFRAIAEEIQNGSEPGCYPEMSATEHEAPRSY